MRDTCFICSRNSYDFEHHGKVSLIQNHLSLTYSIRPSVDHARHAISHAKDMGS